MQVDSAIAKLDARQLNTFTPFTIKQILERAATIEADLGISSILRLQHKITVHYRGMPVVVTSLSGQHHAQCRLEAYLRSRCVGCGLNPLSFEGGIVPVEVETDVSKHVNPDLIRDQAIARANVEVLLSTNIIKSAEQLQKLLVDNRKEWAPHDRFFMIEIAFAATSGTKAGAKFFFGRFIKALPTGDPGIGHREYDNCI